MKFIEEHFIWIITSIITPIVSFFGGRYFFQKKELKSKDIENDSNQIINVGQNLELYQKLFDDISEKLLNANKKVTDQEIMINNYQKEIKDLICTIEDLNIELEKLKSIIKK